MTENSPVSRTPQHEIRRRLISVFCLIAVIAVGFLIRASVIGLPSVQPENRAYLRDENGDPYLTEMDSYYYLRKAREMAERGQVEWMADRGTDPLIGQREPSETAGVRIPLGLSALAYLVWRYFLSFLGVSLTQTAVWMGPVLGALAAWPAFHYVKKRTSLIGGITAGLLVGCAIPFVNHTCAGFFDTDMVLAALPLTAVFAHMDAMRSTETRRQIGYACLSAAVFTLTGFFWRAYYAYYLLAAAGTALSLPFLLIPARSRKRGLTALRGGLFSLLISALFFLLFFGPDSLKAVFSSTRDYQAVRNSTDAMPYVFAFTEEMRPLRLFPGEGVFSFLKADNGSVLGRLGGLIPAALAAARLPAVLAVGRKECKSGGESVRAAEDGIALTLEAVFLGLWAAAGIYLASTGRRFAETAVLPVCILCGLTTGTVFQSATREKSGHRHIAGILCAAVSAAAVIPMILGAGASAGSPRFFVTDSRDSAMAYIRDHTPENAAVASWWDEGYFTEYRAERRTLADGGTDSGAMDWFLAKALLTDDPNLMKGILRMLNGTGTDSLGMLTRHGLTQAEAANELIRILSMDRAEAEKEIRDLNLPPALSEMIYPEASNPLLLSLGTDLLSKLNALEYYAYWDPEERASHSSSFISFSTGSARMENGTVRIETDNAFFSLVLRENGQGKADVFYDQEGDLVIPRHVRVWEDGILIRSVDRGNAPLSVVIIKDGDEYSGALCSEEYCDSMIMRLLVCEDRETDGITWLGTWYSGAEDTCSGAQRRLNYKNQFSWANQVWRITE